MSTLGDAVVIEDDGWMGPFPGFNAYGECDHSFVRCRDCGVEVVPSRKEHASHRAGCPHGDADA